MKILLATSILTLSLMAYSTEKTYSVPATGTLMKYTTQDNNNKNLDTKYFSATGSLAFYNNN
ncbi:MAG: hypothetical protein ACRCXX_00375 [Cetobacterium sp.]|uniref:hypothetical protein n=1 Tax=unclassified Cetobacterium TaxID=2630983 RepID=UPI0006481093|nr:MULTISPECIES: hypothetical protein [unclassified Cetobacterium]